MDKRAVERIVADYMDEVVAGNYLKNKVEEYINDNLPEIIEDALYDVDFHTPAQEMVEASLKNVRLNKTEQARIMKYVKERLLDVVEDRIAEMAYEYDGCDLAGRLADEAIKEAKKKLKMI